MGVLPGIGERLAHHALLDATDPVRVALGLSAPLNTLGRDDAYIILRIRVVMWQMIFLAMVLVPLLAFAIAGLFGDLIAIMASLALTTATLSSIFYTVIIAWKERTRQP